MIVVQNAHDAACWPNAAISYRRAVERNLGDALGDHYRLWFNDHAAHLPASFNPVGRPAGAHHASHRLRRVTRAGAPRPHGVGRGRHRATGRDRLHARHRPAAHARADGGRARRCAAGRARARRTAACAPTSRVGEPVTLAVDADAPAGGGTIIGVEWDFDGTGAFAVPPRRRRRVTRVGPARDHARVRHAGHVLPVCARHRAPRRRRRRRALPSAEPRTRPRRRELSVARPTNDPAFLGNTAIAGVGYTELTKASGRSVLDLATEACARAIDDAGSHADRRRRRRELPLPRGLGAHAGGRHRARHAGQQLAARPQPRRPGALLPRHAGGDGRAPRPRAPCRRVPGAQRAQRRACRHQPRARARAPTSAIPSASPRTSTTSRCGRAAS